VGYPVTDVQDNKDELEVLQKENAALKMIVRSLKDKINKVGVDDEKSPLWRALGHFYSPVANIEDIKADEARIFNRDRRTLPGIGLNEDKQLAVLEEFASFYDDIPFGDEPSDKMRYGFLNGGYSYSDAISLYSMMRRVKPKRIVEVGSGYSSCCMLDTNDAFFNGDIDIRFVEPYPQLLKSLVRPSDLETREIIEKRVQDVDIEVFTSLQENDILFVDSTHVSRVGSDVNHMFFEILPHINEGVYVHFHDIHYPFEYPEHWVYQGRWWTETYLLRAFLEFNSDFEIVYTNTFMQRFHREFFEERMPLCLKNQGASIWLRRKKKSTEE
jgi:methyltransferase family protein